MTQKLILTRGLSGSGKSTWARAWVAEDPDTRGRVNRDDLRFMMFETPNYKWDQEKQVTEAEQNAAVALLKGGRSVVVDATNLRSKYIRNWQKIAYTHGVSFELVDFPISLEDAIARDSLRSGKACVGAGVITAQFEKFTNKGEFQPISPYSPEDDTEEDNLTGRLYESVPGTPDAVIVDIDGTIAKNLSGRGFYDDSRVHEDSPNVPVVDLVQRLHKDGVSIVYSSGRADSCREQTQEWIDTHVGVPGPLLMRKAGDYRKDNIVKLEIFDREIRDKYNVLFSLDDRDQVVAMYRSLGITVLQVDYGDF